MSDLILICENCGNEFVFSVGEQTFYQDKGIPTPKYCPICRSLKAQEKKIPPKPVNPVENTSVEQTKK